MKNLSYCVASFVVALCLLKWTHCEEASCHMKAIDKCIYPGFYFTHRPNTTGIVPNRKEFELMCKVTRKVLKCIDKYMADCGTDAFAGIFALIHEQIVNSMAELCREGPMKEDFLKYSPCIHAQVKRDKTYKETCVNDLQAGLEYMSNLTSIEEWLDTGCCVYNIWEDCITNMTVDRCGGGETAVYNLIDRASGGIIHIVCRRNVFDANSDWCKSKLPPPGTKAKGRYSNSALSKYFTFICPNTGW